MKKHLQNSQKPSIVIGETDHQRLNKLALAAADRLPEVSDGLLIELERALVVAGTSGLRMSFEWDRRLSMKLTPLMGEQ